MFNFSPAIPARSDLDWCWYLRRQGKPGEALERVLHDLGALDPGGWAHWQASNLTATGAPVEMQFSTAQTDLRLITEIADPSTPAADKVRQACKIMTQFGDTVPSGALRNVISAAQGAGPLHYGARLGLQHGADGIKTHLYAELPEGSSDLQQLVWPQQSGPEIPDLGRNIHATMLSYDGTTGYVTITYKSDNDLHHLIPALAEIADVSPDVLSLSIDRLTNGAPKAALANSMQEFSFLIIPNSAPVLTVYLASGALFQTDAKIARQVKTFGTGRLVGYESLVDHQPPAPVGQTHHGKIGLTPRQNTAPILSASVAAPWFCPSDHC